MNMKMISIALVDNYNGTPNATIIHTREVFKGALLANAHAIIIAHNHPTGEVEPSNTDKMVTNTGKLLDVSAGSCHHKRSTRIDSVIK
jgi:DNA repair protein RadC